MISGDKMQFTAKIHKTKRYGIELYQAYSLNGALLTEAFSERGIKTQLMALIFKKQNESKELKISFKKG